MAGFKEIVMSTRPWSFPMTIISITLGGILAFYINEVFRLDLFLLALFGSVSLHASANVINDYFDTLYGVDKPGAPTTRYRPHPIVGDFLSSNQLLRMTIGFLVFSMLIALYLAIVSGIYAFILGVLGAIFALSYSVPPFKYKYRAMGEIFVFICWGPIMVLGSYYVQTSILNNIIILASFPIGLLVAAVLLANNIRDIEYDSSTGIKTIPIILGKVNSIYIYILMITIPYLIIGLLVIFGILGFSSLIVLLTLPEALNLIKIFRHEIPELADPMTAKLVLLFGALYILGVSLSSLGFY